MVSATRFVERIPLTYGDGLPREGIPRSSQCGSAWTTVALPNWGRPATQGAHREVQLRRLAKSTGLPCRRRPYRDPRSGRVRMDGVSFMAGRALVHALLKGERGSVPRRWLVGQRGAGGKTRRSGERWNRVFRDRRKAHNILGPSQYLQISICPARKRWCRRAPSPQHPL